MGKAIHIPALGASILKAEFAYGKGQCVEATEKPVNECRKEVKR